MFYRCGFRPCFRLRAERKTMICCNFQHKTTKSLVFHAALDIKGIEFLWNMYNIAFFSCSNRTTISLLQFAPGGHLELMVESWLRGWEATWALGRREKHFLSFQKPGGWLSKNCQSWVTFVWRFNLSDGPSGTHQSRCAATCWKETHEHIYETGILQDKQSGCHINYERPGGSSPGTNWCRHRKRKKVHLGAKN